MSIDHAAIQAGFDFEREFAEEMGLGEQPGSGNQWHSKLDADGSTILWSLKSTKHKTFELSEALIEEIAEAVYAPGGVGGEHIGALAVRLKSLSGEPIDLIVQTKADFKRMHEESRELKLPQASRAEKIRAGAAKTQLERMSEVDED